MIPRTPESIHFDYDSELGSYPQEPSDWKRVEVDNGMKSALMLGYVVAFVVLTGIIFCAVTCNPSPAYPMDVVIETIAREASGESLEAQAYVAAVIRQRALERHQTYAEVCKAPFQFSCWDKGTKQKPRTAKEYETAMRAWEYSAKITDKVNLYHDVTVLPYWARSKRVHFVRQIGRLLFYREDRA